MEWTTACPDWERRIVARESLIPFPPLFPDEAQKALDVFGDLRLHDAQSMPMREASGPWIMEFASAIFGAYDEEAGRRLITEFFLLISKKNAKSTTAAGIMLTALVRNWRDSAEFLILAPTIEIANNSFLPARNMVMLDETLSGMLHVQEHYRTITHRVTGATLKVVAADNETVSGKKATGVLIDEFWLFGKRGGAEGLLLEAMGGQASRPEGFTIYLSTQSDEPPAGVFRARLQYARDVRDGVVNDPQFLPVLYEFPRRFIDEKLYRDPANFYITNPNIGASVDSTYIERKLRLVEAGVEKEQEVLAKHLNIEIGLSLRNDRWAGADFWEGQAQEGLTFDEVLRRCDAVAAGIDGGGLDDLLGLSIVGRDRGTREWLSWSRAWAHPILLYRRKSEAQRFRDFEAGGDLVITAEMGDAEAELAGYVKRAWDAGVLYQVGVDPYGIGSILDALVAAGVPQKATGPDRDVVIGISQGWKLGAAIKTAERALAAGVLVHGGSPLMAWCVGNARVEPKGNAILITKQASGTAKIDPLMALFDAVSILSLNPQIDGPADFQFFVA